MRPNTALPSKGIGYDGTLCLPITRGRTEAGWWNTSRRVSTSTVPVSSSLIQHLGLTLSL